MSHHPAIEPGRVAVVTGAASGIGLAAAARLAELGMKVCMADQNADALERACRSIRDGVGRSGDVIGVAVDVSRREDVERLKQKVDSAFGDVALLMNNAGRGAGGGIFDSLDRWRALIETNLFGVLHGIQVFAPGMIASRAPAAIVNTGSKQGITCPPGNTAYNVSKAGVKVVTEALAHELRNIDGCEVTAHLLIPGFTFTGMTAGNVSEKPAGAWTPAQVVEFMLSSLHKRDFYILCPDNDVTRGIDEKRMQWAAGDIIENRPALSRWHPDFAEAFADYMKR
jgi:NAD(P)-dependent dehydrogenase (short-subunit alcohol dehydrogenase family)